jgi:hypothetical protein
VGSWPWPKDGEKVFDGDGCGSAHIPCGVSAYVWGSQDTLVLQWHRVSRVLDLYHGDDAECLHFSEYVVAILGRAALGDCGLVSSAIAIHVVHFPKPLVVAAGSALHAPVNTDGQWAKLRDGH